jgi:DEAD/DEAH box helicase domain-containing protein
LIGAPVSAVTDSGAPTGDKHLLLWNPPMVNRELGIRASARSQSTRIARLAIKSGLKVLVFAQTRLLVEVITKYLKDVFDHDPRLPQRIRGYRGGYLPTERRDVERAMREGRIDGLVGTSALELGVDIGSLDVVVLNGYPGSIAATRQRLGRAGRRGRPSLGVLVAGSTALDQYIVRHPEFFEGASPEMARIHADHPLILLDHIRCAAFELPFVEGERFGTVEPAPWLEVLAEAEVLHQEAGRWEWIADSYPANAVSLRSVADGNFVVVDRSEGRQQIIAEVDYSAAALTLYEGAIYLLQSQPFQVEQLDWTGRKAYVSRVSVDYYTDAIDYSRLKVLEASFSSRQDALDAFLAAAHALHLVAGLSAMAEARDLQQSVGSGDGSWSRIDGFGRDLPEGAEADPRFAPAVFLYDNYPGGIGMTEPLYERRAALVLGALRLVEACDCAAGCPACVGAALQVDGETLNVEHGPKRLALRVLGLWAGLGSE